MERDIFYNTDKLTHSEQEKLLRKAYSICDKWWFDKLDCRESFARQRVEEISFEEAMTHFVKGAKMVVIQRQHMLYCEDKPYLEVGFCSMQSPVDYFLWIIVDLKHKHEFIKGLYEL